MNLHVYGNTAYRCELSLFRAHRVSAVEAELVEIEDGTRHLFRVEVADVVPRFVTDAVQAMAMFRQDGGLQLTEVIIL
jgi:hypothetical protein